jgi:hypothetical protein
MFIRKHLFLIHAINRPAAAGLSLKPIKKKYLKSNRLVFARPDAPAITVLFIALNELTGKD